MARRGQKLRLSRQSVRIEGAVGGAWRGGSGGVRGVRAEDEEEAERRARQREEGEGQPQQRQVRDERAVLDQVEVGEALHVVSTRRHRRVRWGSGLGMGLGMWVWSE